MSEATKNAQQAQMVNFTNLQERALEGIRQQNIIQRNLQAALDAQVAFMKVKAPGDPQ